jgi:hypothetical protein
MNFRATLETPKVLERPIQIVGSDIGTMRDWAKRILALHPDGRVKIYESAEVLVETIDPLRPETPVRDKTKERPAI